MTSRKGLLKFTSVFLIAQCHRRRRASIHQAMTYRRQTRKCWAHLLFQLYLDPQKNHRSLHLEKLAVGYNSNYGSIHIGKTNFFSPNALLICLYRKFFTFVMSINITGIVLAAVGVWSYPHRYTGACVLGNLLVAILMRNELFGRLLYLIVNTLFAKVNGNFLHLWYIFWYGNQWTPLWFRLGCTSVLQHLGGIHSGCATSGFLWLIYSTVTIFIDYKNNHDAVLATGVITNIVIGLTIMAAFPWVRNTHHKWVKNFQRAYITSNIFISASLNAIIVSWDGTLSLALHWFSILIFYYRTALLFSKEISL